MQNPFASFSLRQLTRFTLLLYVGMLLLLVAATFVASAVGVHMASEVIYQSGWVFAWWIALGACFLLPSAAAVVP